ncbi:hypothetical protein NQ315_012973 [Exocentrus adspersus]|uniref:DDE Tnp4 domain-containing protein n=1 Tax=Exocentrus adspersus TaxID=1586481 RepID=A0AAV8VSP6_9CUCU|nr:hypothetical protein NQ315_012973 [Exocentrus adspersus]
MFMKPCSIKINLEKDMDNYWQYKLTGNKKTAPGRQTGAKRRRLEMIQQAETEFAAASTSEIVFDPEAPGTSSSSTCHIEEPILEREFTETSVTQTPLQDKSVQVKSKAHYRSKGINVKPDQSTVAVSPIKLQQKDIATSPLKLPQAKRNVGYDLVKEASSSSVSTSINDEYTESSNSEYLTEEEEAESEFKRRMLADSLTAATKEPKLLLGVPKESYYIVQMLATKSGLSIVNILITLRKIRLNESFAILGLHFGMSESNVSRIFAKKCTPYGATFKGISLVARQTETLRIHVERVIGRIREFNMLLPHACIDNHLISSLDDIIVIVCGLINIQDHLIKIQL